MKNILGTTDNLELFNKEGKQVYEFLKHLNGNWYERTYDSNGNLLTFKNSDAYSYVFTYDLNGKLLTYKNNKGHWIEYTRDSNGKELTFKNSNGVTRGFDIPEYTMEQLVENYK
jgi:YD repeat-containing protein